MIQNVTKNSVLAKNFSFKEGLGAMKGLLGKSKPEAIVFETRFGIHTFGLQFPIDLIILDNKKTVKVAKTIKPSRIALWNIKYKTVIELPVNTLIKTGTKIGDIIAL